MKLNWGVLIVFGLSLFALGILLMVFKSMNQKIDLVSENYYESDSTASERYQQLNFASSSGHRFEIREKDDSIFVFHSGPELDEPVRIFFYRPDDKSLDFNSRWNPINSLYYSINSSKLHTGLWKVSFQFTKGGKKGLSEVSFFKK